MSRGKKAALLPPLGSRTVSMRGNRDTRVPVVTNGDPPPLYQSLLLEVTNQAPLFFIRAFIGQVPECFC